MTSWLCFLHRNRRTNWWSGVLHGSTDPLGTGAALLTALVWELCGGDGAVSTGTGLLSAGVGVRLGEAGSLSIAVGVQSARVWVMCGRAGSRACTTGFYLHQEVALFYLKTVFLLR